MQATPATWRLLLEAGWRGTAGFKALCGGEALPADLAAAAAAARRRAVEHVRPDRDHGLVDAAAGSTRRTPITIGTPIANTQIHVLDEDRQPVPVGVVGELYIGGDGVTARLPRSARADRRALRSGSDRRPIRARGSTAPATSAAGAQTARSSASAAPTSRSRCAAIASSSARSRPRWPRIPAWRRRPSSTREDRPGDVRLVAYLVARGRRAPGDDVLREHLARTPARLHDPAAVRRRSPALPLTANGKVDRQALPAPSGPALAETASRSPPRTPTETEVAQAYMEALALPRLGVHDDFFALGGHSLLVAQMTREAVAHARPRRADARRLRASDGRGAGRLARRRHAVATADAPPTIPRRAGAATGAAVADAAAGLVSRAAAARQDRVQRAVGASPARRSSTSAGSSGPSPSWCAASRCCAP